MESAVLKKRINTFRLSSGQLRGVSQEVVMEVLRGWESWPGSSADFYKGIGLKKHQLSTLIREGKKIVKSGVVAESEFKELGVSAGGLFATSTGGIEVQVDGGRLVRFGQVDQLVEFLKKTAP